MVLPVSQPVCVAVKVNRGIEGASQDWFGMSICTLRPPTSELSIAGGSTEPHACAVASSVFPAPLNVTFDQMCTCPMHAAVARPPTHLTLSASWLAWVKLAGLGHIPPGAPPAPAIAPPVPAPRWPPSPVAPP